MSTAAPTTLSRVSAEPSITAPSAPTAMIEPIMASPILAAVAMNQPSPWSCARPESHSTVGPAAPKSET